MRRRVFALLMTLVLLVSMIPTSVFAEGNVGSGTAEAPYQVGDTVINDGTAQPAGVTAENTYWVRNDVYDTSVPVCGKEEHDHTTTPCAEIPAAVECTREGHPVDGTLTYTHDDGTACTLDVAQNKWFTIGTVLDCGKEAHAHGNTCYQYVNTVWTLTAVAVPEDPSEGSSERVCLEGCILDGEEEHLENGGQCLVWVACTKTEGCEGPEGHEGECYSGIPMVEAVTIRVRRNNSGVRAAEVKIVYAADETNVVATATANNSGNATVQLPDGSYKAVVNYTSGYYIYEGEQAFTLEDGEITSGGSGNWGNSNYVNVNVTRRTDETLQGKEIYDDTIADPGYFNHVDIRVQGTYTTGTTNALQKYNIKLQNASIYVDNPGNNRDYSEEFTDNSETYEWRKDGIRVYKDAVVTLTCDIINSSTGEVMKNDFTTSFSGEADFIQGIINCDMKWGLDFIINPQEIIEAVTHDVTYVWKVLGSDGNYTSLPAGAPAEPAQDTDIDQGTEYVYDTEYVSGTSFSDYDNGLWYTFHGWDTWSHSATYNVNTAAAGYNALDDGDTSAANNQTITLTNDTYIYGYWTITELEPVEAHIAVEKVIEGLDNNPAALALAQKMYFRINPGIDLDGDGVCQVDIDYPMIQQSGGEYKLPVYQYNTPFIVTEHNADIPGYTRTTTIAVTGANASGDATTGDTVNVTLDPVYDVTANGHLGTVTYTNTYTKNTGEAVSEWPALNLLKTAYDTNASQAGVEFTLYSDAACQDVVGTYTTGSNGMLVIDFDQVADVAAGTYYLKETKALDGYVADSAVFELVLKEDKTVEEIRDNAHVEVTYYDLDVTVPDTSDAIFSETRATSVYYRLHVINYPELGGMVLSKDVTGIAETDKDKVAATVIVHGPITRDDNNAITDLGNTRTVVLNSGNNWTLELDDLPLGEYLVHESFASVHGYTWSGVTYANASGTNYAIVNYNNISSASVPVTSDASVVVKLANTYEAWTSADFYIRKIDENGEPLAGATFQLFADENGTPATGTGITLSATSGADGYAHFTGYTVPDGQETVTYYLKETSAPDGYQLNTTLYKVEIKAITNDGKTTYEPKITAVGATTQADWNSHTDLLKVTNISIKGTITIQKTVDGNPQGLSYVQVQVTGEDYNQTFVLNADNQWSATISELELGTYTITERDASVPGYDYEVKINGTVRNSTTVTLTANNADTPVAVEIINTYTRNEEVFETPTSLTVVKVGEDGQTALSGAQFTLTKMDGTTAVSSVTYTTNDEGIVVFDMLAGSIVNGVPVDGTYYLTETKAPAGYAASDTVWVIKVKEDNGQIRWTLNEKENIFEGFWEWITGKEQGYTYNAAGHLIVENVELADLTIEKSFVDETGNSITPTDGVVIEMEIFDASGKLYDTVELTAANNWSATLSDIPAGDYTVTEATGSLHGYTWTGMKVNGTNTANAIEVEVKNGEDITLNVTNTYTAWQTVDFTVFKTADDGHTPLAGAIFNLYSDEACQTDVTSTYLEYTGNYVEGESNKTTTTGTLHFQGFDVQEGQTATFYLKETKAPYGYTGSAAKYVLTITHDTSGYDITCDNTAFNHGSDVLTVVNEEMLGQLTITKEVVGLTNLAEVKFDITGPNGYSNTVTLNAADAVNGVWTETLTGLHLGSYTITERDASVPGYDLTVTYNGQATGTVELKEEHATTAAVVAVINTYKQSFGNPVHNPGSFTVLKVDKDGNPLPGAKFELVQGITTVAEGTTGDDGKYTFTGLQGSMNTNGEPISVEYTLKEVLAPTGYQKTEATWTVTVNEKDGAVKVELNREGNFFQNIYDWIVDILNAGTAWDDANLILTVPNEELTPVPVKKVWDDSDYHDRPDSITAQLLCDGKVVDEVVLNAGNSWKYTWNSYTDASGNVITLTDAHTWTVAEKEDFSDLGYEAPAYVGEADDVSIVNKRDINLIDVTVTKQWDTNGDHHEAPESVTVQLMGNGAAYGEEVVLNAANNWTHTWEDLSDAYEWTVVEDDVEDYEVKNIKVDTANNGDLTFTITNERIVNDMTITVTKHWVNGEKDKKVTFPTSVRVALYRDGKRYETVTLNASNNWTYTWTGLTDEYEWEFDEPNVPNGYIDTYKYTITENSNGSIDFDCDVTNTYNSNPKTGDGFDMGIWMMGMTVTVLALFVLLLMGGKKGKYHA